MFIINSKVRDFNTNEGIRANVRLTDANGNLVKINGETIGRATDGDGNFIIPVSDESVYITASSIGYGTLTHPADDYRQNDNIYLIPKTNQIKEVVIRPKPEATPKNKFDWSKFLNNLLPKNTPKQAPKQAPPPPKKDNTLLYILIGGGVLLLTLIIILIIKRKK